MSEKCIRCGEDGDDRRTLWHACFYEMSEFAVPFERAVLFHADMADLTPAREPFRAKDKHGHPIGPDGGIVLAPGAVRSSGELIPHTFYTLRVCKDCRADWLCAIEAWSNSAAPRGGGE
jgi:hypothetical protein